MNLEQPTEENLKILLDGIAERLDVVNRTIMDPKDYDLNKYNELKLMYDMINQKGHLSAQETQAFIEELRAVRKQSS
ncbi:MULTISPECIES: DUF1128 domain-containing protein [Virgibacillus]|uniref:Uncharacterized protein n=2 Tax=Virgibacillus TaxID=84406 RepID=A0A024QDW8_9BACI|nr:MULTISPECIES: DUF1128 domain-containing protein [Virgibacillus]EQB36448.1 hypothetical protein M948_15565 [Virgibacillus sp. CM-4]MYL42281.1 DUF1128 family protein [Virgibacillus massiliensis]GGJ43795.1 hypothetical protein GCM10007111_02360 [Virgibacillus kapii]CDQ40146.1 hypothetical protein BN990_02464 [Virgibacillus massiliensis]